MRIPLEHALDFGIDVAGHVHEIGAAVVVEIGHAGGPLDMTIQHAEAGGGCDILEDALPHVAIERRDVVGEMRLEDVEPPIGVEVADRHTHAGLLGAVLAVGDAALDGRIGEGAIMIVVVQDRCRRITRHVDIDPAVAIEVRRGGGHRITAGDPRDA